MVQSTKAVITTTGSERHPFLISSFISGPFDRYGSDLVKFCAGFFFFFIQDNVLIDHTRKWNSLW
jgi:hypothetical protein